MPKKPKKPKKKPKIEKTKETIRAGRGGDLSLYPGRFYESLDKELWCCIGIAMFREPHCRATCVRVFSERRETFYLDGRYDAGGVNNPSLVREVIAANAVVL